MIMYYIRFFLFLYFKELVFYNFINLFIIFIIEYVFSILFSDYNVFVVFLFL